MIPWNKELPPEITKTWSKWEKVLPSYVEIPRPITSVQEKIREIKLCLFGDASIIGTSAVVKSLDSQSRGPVFKTAGWLQGRLSLSSFRG